MPEICKNCSSEVTQNFCPNCGQASQLQKIDRKYIANEIQQLFNFEKGFFYTAKELLLRPGISVREFILENRNKHMKPVTYLILTSLLYTLVAGIFNASEIYNEKEKLMFENSSIGDLQHWVQSNYGYSNILMGFFIALCVKLFFRKHNFNTYEIAMLICFVMGQGMLFITVEALFIDVISKSTFIGILTFIAFAYPTFAIGQFFGSRKFYSYLKAFLAYILGYTLFNIAIIIVGLLVDVIIK